MENSKQSLDDISGPSRTEQTGDCGSSVPNPSKTSTAPDAGSQVIKWLFYTIYILYLQSIPDLIYFNNLFKSRAALMKLKVPLLPEILTKVNRRANLHPVIL